MAAAADPDPMAGMQEMLRQIVATVQTLGEQVNTISGRVQGVGDLDVMRITLQELELAVSRYRDSSPAHSKMNLINPKDIKVREFDGEEKHFHDFLDRVPDFRRRLKMIQEVRNSKGVARATAPHVG